MSVPSSSSLPPPPSSSSLLLRLLSYFQEAKDRARLHLVLYDGSRRFFQDQKVTGFTVAPGVTTIGEYAYWGCPRLASLGVMREGVRVIERFAFALCPLLTLLQGLPESLTTIGLCAFSFTGLASLDGLPPAVTTIGFRAFSYCAALTSIGPGFSPDCNVDPTAFASCDALFAAAQAEGFASAIEWGKHHWLAVNRSNCRFVVLSAVRRVRRDDDGEEGSPLLKRIALLCDDLVREVLEFVGACE